MKELNYLRKARLEKLLTQEDLAKLSGISRRTIAYIEAGKACRQSTKRKLLIALGFDFSQKTEVWP